VADSTNVLIYCGNGYIFDEIYLPLIERHNENWKYVVVLGDFYLTEVTIRTVERLVREKRVLEYHVIPLPDREIIGCRYHREIRQLSAAIDHYQFGLLLLGGDFYLPDRYLLRLAKAQHARTVVLFTATIWRIIEEYQKRNGKETTPTSPLQIKKSNVLVRILRKNKVLHGFLAALRYGIRPSSVWRLLRNRLWISFHYYFYPLYFSRTIFPRSKYDNYAFASGRTDTIIGYDRMEVEALKSVVPTVRDVRLAKHPTAGVCRCSADKGVNRRKLLVTFNGRLSEELQGEKFDRWVWTIAKGIELARVSEVHLRFHPRTSDRLKWPQRIRETVEGLGCEVVISNPVKESMAQIACDYVGVIGGPSGSLKVARAVCDRLFVVGLPNCGDGAADDQQWTIGAGEGIRWIEEGKGLESSHLQPVQDLWEGHVSLGETLDELVQAGNVDA
jgi:hypothetical protein